jgi:hypothetical protein
MANYEIKIELSSQTINALAKGGYQLWALKAVRTQGRGAPGAVSILNQDSRSWTVGQSQSIDGESSPVCALPLRGQMQSQIVPVEKVLLMFSSNVANTGTVLSRTVAPGLLVDLTTQKNRTVRFDVSSGWNSPGTWARQVTPNTDTVPLLMQG